MFILQFALSSTSEAVGRTSQEKMTTRSRSWVFTLNNYTEEEVEAVRCIKCEYLVFGKEVGEQGTPHLQGFVHLKNAATMSALKKKIPRSHLEVRMGSIDEATDYCKKDGDFEEFGVKPLSQNEKGAANKKRWARIWELAENGDEETFKDEFPGEAYRDMATFRSHKKPCLEVMSYADADTPHEWWFGKTGTGKSKTVWEQYPGHYQKHLNKWWCQYIGQEVVVIEEATPKKCEHLASYFKQWIDRYPFPGEIKGGRIEGIRPKKIIVTSNYSIEDCFPDRNDWEPLRRKMKIVEFKPEVLDAGVEVDAPAWHPSYNCF